MKRTLLILTDLILASLALARAQTLPNQESLAPHHLVVLYRNNTLPSNADAIAASVNTRAHHLPLFGLSALQVPGDEATAIARIRTQPNVAAVLHDRYVSGHALILRAPVATLQQPARLTSNISVAGSPSNGYPPLGTDRITPVISYAPQHRRRHPLQQRRSAGRSCRPAAMATTSPVARPPAPGTSPAAQAFASPF